jgi:hypothetical protein
MKNNFETILFLWFGLAVFSPEWTKKKLSRRGKQNHEKNLMTRGINKQVTW